MMLVTKTLASLVACLVIGCGGFTSEDIPSCGSLGCPLQPSGSDVQWEPCTDDLCWCPQQDADPAICRATGDRK